MAENVREIPEQPKNSDCHPLHFSSFNIEQDVDKEVRLRFLKERQNEERQKKLEEIKAQALAAQRFKEQKEHERRRRLEEMRLKDDTKRHQVEERKRAINDAERDRLESILRRNQEREARIESKKRNERSNLVFAFGSSTPRMLDPTDLSVSFWGHRRATSTQNITSTSTGSSLTRRQSERDLDAGSKKRAISAGGLERAGEGLTSPTTPAGCASGYLGRRRTDLVPTIPSRDSSFHSSTSRKSLNHSPGRAYSMSRLDQLAKPRKPILPALNEASMAPKSSVTRSMSHLAHVGTKLSPRQPLSKADSRSLHHLSPDRPVAPPRVNRATQLRQQKLQMALQSGSTSEASSRPSSSMSQQSTNSITSSVNVRHRISGAPRRPRPASIAVTGVTHEIRSSFDRGDHKPPLPKARKSLSKTNTSERIEKGSSKSKPVKSPAEETAPKIVAVDKKEVTQEKKPEEKVSKPIEPTAKPLEPIQSKESTPTPLASEAKEAPVYQAQEVDGPKSEQATILEVPPQEPPQPQPATRGDNIIQEFINNERSASEDVTNTQQIETSVHSQTATTTVPGAAAIVTETKELKPDSNESSEMTTSVSKPRITTEEEAKAALAERRRLIREEAERQAELERQRIEAEQKAEYERQLKEEEQARLLAEMQRQAEQERLQEAIRETQRREEEERLRREEEQRQKLLKEEADKKAKEEAEKQKAELQKKLENEEKEREERRRRVEMIMSRTRGKNSNTASQQNSQDKNENSSENKQQMDENQLNEVNQVNENKLNGTKQENGTTDSSTTKNGKDVDVGIVDNIIPDESVKNANTVADTINADSLNSNSAWQASSQQFLDVS
ncbi:MAP7 domain-containing protein 1 isoform X3 [Dendroctonus ponderosae]|uniref:MAP7 domain-containing protein n=1 Tax=Dendroctonus ponderosae TaxID=77166 RepID=A0AAR5P0X7_DENPD|nr:MAP7 domain-containing protein 1 isoform X3 [Dendroctonus ponderosae]